MQQATIKQQGRKCFRLEANGLQIEIRTTRSERAQFELDESDFELSREGCWGDFLLQINGEIVARATKRSAFSRKFDIVLGDGRYTLIPISSMRSSFRLLREEGVLAEVSEKGFFRSWFEIQQVETLPARELVFVAWLVLIMWQRASDAFVPPAVG